MKIHLPTTDSQALIDGLVEWLDRQEAAVARRAERRRGHFRHLAAAEASSSSSSTNNHPATGRERKHESS